MLYVFSYILDEINVILPFNIVAIRIPEDNKKEVYSLVKNLDLKNLILKTSEAILTKLKKVNIKYNYFDLGKFEVEKYGFESAYYKQVRYISNLDELVVSSLNPNLSNFPENITYLEEFTSVPELVIGYIYSRYIREYYLKRLHLQYPELEINKHKGELTKNHESILLNLNRLPNFYNESFLINYYLSKQIVPTWANNYIKNNYEQLIK
jgi:hypothetical protein